MADHSEIRGGIEYYVIGDHEDAQCARCGSSVASLECWNCGGEGYTHHDCGEDCCCCRYPENNVPCDVCHGQGGRLRCISSPEWCEANPMPGRNHIESTAVSAEAWSDVL